MLRLFIPDLIPVSKLIYLDIDIIVNTDLMELYTLECGTTGIGMKRCLRNPDDNTIISINGKLSGNCGILVLDLDTLRKNNFTEKCLEIASKQPDKHDQYIINLYCQCNYVPLEPRFNIFLKQDDSLIETTSDFILHYAGSQKPYNSNVGKYQYLWYREQIKNERANCFCYWDGGIEKMPPMILYMYKYNLNQSLKYNFNLILITDYNVDKFITPHPRFFSLRPNFKSDIVRYAFLHKYGGIWLDTDGIITKNLNILYTSLLESNFDVIVDVEVEKDDVAYIGCASLTMRPNSLASEYCHTYVNNYLDSNKDLTWGEIGPGTIRSLYTEHPLCTKVNGVSETELGCNFITWEGDPGVNKHKWIMSINDAYDKAKRLLDNPNCFYILSWTIYRRNNIEGDINKFVFDNPESVFYYLIRGCNENVKSQAIKTSSIPNKIETKVNTIDNFKEKLDKKIKHTSQPYLVPEDIYENVFERVGVIPSITSPSYNLTTLSINMAYSNMLRMNNLSNPVYAPLKTPAYHNNLRISEQTYNIPSIKPIKIAIALPENTIQPKQNITLGGFSLSMPKQEYVFNDTTLTMEKSKIASVNIPVDTSNDIQKIKTPSFKIPNIKHSIVKPNEIPITYALPNITGVKLPNNLPFVVVENIPNPEPVEVVPVTSVKTAKIDKQASNSVKLANSAKPRISLTFVK
jgi:hypothetical protein